jgi:predicted tellurium resistance membrane protein TerC
MVVGVLAIAALFLVRRVPRNHWYVLLYALFVYWTALHLAFYGKDRFRLPLMPVFAILAALTLVFLWERRGRLFRPKAQPPAVN